MELTISKKAKVSARNGVETVLIVHFLFHPNRKRDLLVTITATPGHLLASPVEPAESPITSTSQLQRRTIVKNKRCTRSAHFGDEAAGIKKNAVTTGILKDAHK